MESSEVAESRGPESSASGGARTFKRRREPPALDVEILASSPSSCVIPEAKKRIAFKDPVTPTSSRKVVTVLLPNNSKLVLPCRASSVSSVQDFLSSAQSEAEREFGNKEPVGKKKRKRQVRWGPNVYLEDSGGNRIPDIATLKNLLQKSSVTILLQDGEGDTKHFHEWDITPEPKMLGRLPQGYNVETALADEVDNALQAVWNIDGQRRLICVEVQSEKISIFDTGFGMDADTIQNWGKPGGSSHRDVHMQAIGGQPPFLKPHLGKYGAGGVAAALHLGSFVTVSSKTRKSKKVVTLDLSKEDLDKRCRTKQEIHWLTPGQFRDMTAEEKKKAPGGSFTMVEISKLKRHYMNLDKEIRKTRCLLADIYYDYIHSEEFGVANRSLQYPVEFEVNGQNLAEITECETAILLQHRCNGDPFEIDLGFTGPIEDPDEAERIRSRNKSVANARVTCEYFPNVKGKEKLDAVIEELTYWEISKKNFDDFPRVVVRWLGRLLPENGWESFPFMKVPVKRVSEGWKYRWERRVRATIVLDAGFHPTQSKTQLERDHPFTVALQNLGDPDEMKKSSAAVVEVVIKRGEKVLNSKQLHEEYMNWLMKMHDTYDEEVEFLDKNPTFICDQPIHDILGLNKDLKHIHAIVFYKHMKDSNGEWNVSDSTPLHVKIPKGACKNSANVYATIEWFYCLGNGGDEHGEVKMVVRPIDVPKDEGSEMKKLKNEKLAFALKRSKVYPWTLSKNSKLDKHLVQRLSPQEWAKKEAELANNAPSYIEVLNEGDSKALKCDKTLPTKLAAGSKLPEFLAVVRPKSGTGASFKQQMVYARAFDMKMQVSFREGSSSHMKGTVATSKHMSSKSGSDNSSPDGTTVVWEGSVRGDSRNNVKGVYFFDTKALGLDNKFVKQGTYHLRFELATTEFQVRQLNWTISVDPSTESKGWRICNHKDICERQHPQSIPCLTTRLNDQLNEELYLTKPDIYDNLQYISRIPRLRVLLETSDGIPVLSGTSYNSENLVLSSDRQHLILKKKVLFSEGNIGPLGPTHEGRLVFHIKDDAGSKLSTESTTEMQCRVYPGQIATFSVLQGPSLKSGPPISIADRMRPNDIIETLYLQGRDVSGNAVEKGERVEVRLENLKLQDKIGPFRELAEQGILDLGGLLMVIGPYNSRGSVCLFCENRKLIEILVTVASCRLEIVQPVRRTCTGGSTLEGVIVEIFGGDGLLDTSIDGPYHTLTLGWMKNITCPVIKGRCELPSFQLPSMHGPWCGQICHTTDKNLKVNLELNLELELACRLALPADYQTASAKNDEVVVLKFLALDGIGQPAILTADMIENMIVDVEPDSSHCSVMWSKIIAASGSLTRFEVHVQLGGKAGMYTVALRSSADAYPALDLQQQPGSTALVAWGVNLKHGKFARVDYQIMINGSSADANSIEIPHMSIFPAINVQLLDGYNNSCLLYDKQTLVLLLEKQGGPRGKQGGSVCQSCQISNGIGLFQPFEMEAEEGKYQMTISVSSLTATVKEPKVYLTVTRGGFPAALRLTEKSPLKLVLSADMKRLRNLTVIVDPVGNQPLRRLNPPIMLLIAPERSESSCIQEYVGEEVSSKSLSKSFVFPPMVVPTEAGKYLLKFLLPDHTLTPCLRQLVVRHGPPARLELRVKQAEQEGSIAQAKIVDMYGNVCTDETGLILNLTLSISDEEFQASPSIGVQRSFHLISKEKATVESGVATFEKIELSQGGRPGPYVLTVSVEPDQKLAQFGQLGNLDPSEFHMLVTSESQLLQQKEDLQSYHESVKTRRDVLSKLKKRMDTAKEELCREREKLERLRQSKAAHNNAELFSAQDEMTLRQEQQRPRRGEQDIMEDMDRQARQRTNAAAALAFLQARKEGNFLSPKGPLAGEAIGLPVTLARVENEAFNRILCEFLSPGTLMLPVCKTQEGVNSLQRKTGGVLDTSYGLASISRCRLAGFYDVLALSDVKPWVGSIDHSHPQLLLNIPEPWLAGTNREVPSGFLGFAVNLLHMKVEDLRVQVRVTSMPTRPFGLRETLFYHLLHKVQVYDTRENMNKAKQYNAIDGGAMSLDGYLIRANMRQQLGVPDSNHSSISFALVPYEERLATCGLFPPACEAFRRHQRRQSIQHQVDAQERQIQDVQASFEHKRRLCEDLSNEIRDAEKSLRDEEAKEREVRSQQEGLRSSLNQRSQLRFNVL